MSQTFYTSVLLLAHREDHFQLLQKFLSTQADLAHLILNSPQVTIYNSEQEIFRISLVRRVIEECSYSGYQDQPRVIVMMSLDKASLPAQHALLKILEEPPTSTQLLITADHPQLLLPTIRSRCLVWQENHSQDTLPPTPNDLDWEKYFHLSVSQIIEQADQYRDREAAITFLESILKSLHTANTPQPRAKLTQAMQTISQGLTKLRLNASVKLVLENCFFQIRS